MVNAWAAEFAGNGPTRLFIDAFSVWEDFQ
jgi:hypothetical protein